MKKTIGLVALTIMISISGCSTAVTGCDGFSYITVPPQYVDVIGRYLKEQIASHNRYGVGVCGWQKPSS